MSEVSLFIDDDGYVTFVTTETIDGTEIEFVWNLHHDGWDVYADGLPGVPGLVVDDDEPFYRTHSVTWPTERDFTDAREIAELAIHLSRKR